MLLEVNLFCSRRQGERESEGHVNAKLHIQITLIKYIVHKLLGIVTTFFPSFIKVPVLLKITDVNLFFYLCLKLQIDYVCYEQSLNNYFSHGKVFMKVFLQQQKPSSCLYRQICILINMYILFSSPKKLLHVSNTSFFLNPLNFLNCHFGK